MTKALRLNHDDDFAQENPLELRRSSFIRHSSFAIRHFSLLLLAFLLPACSQAESPDEAAVRAHLTKYFSSWSARDMESYGACFQAQARITFVMKGGAVSVEALTDFLHSQRMAHEQSTSPMKEEPTDMKITAGNSIAQAAVKWKLTKAGTAQTGTDFFTLARTGEGWRIVALVWEQD